MLGSQKMHLRGHCQSIQHRYLDNRYCYSLVAAGASVLLL
jgi:hypothetical protein